MKKFQHGGRSFQKTTAYLQDGWLVQKHLNLEMLLMKIFLKQLLNSLSSAFAKSTADLINLLIAYKITNWTNVQNIYGGYSYETPQSASAKKLLIQPVEETIFFAGEALDYGVMTGTVEAALESGKQAALKIIKD